MLDDRVLALCELSNDLLYHRIPGEALPYYADASLKAGREAARRFAGREIVDLYREHGIAIRCLGSAKKGYGVVLRGQAVMSRGECSVEIYRDSIAELSRHSAWEGRSLTEEEALHIHLAHEFFHFWEYRNGCSVAERLKPVTTFSFLGLRRTAHINRCGEVAAHAFAKELLGLPCLPNFYDYLYLIDTGKMERRAFERLTGKMSALLSGSGAEQRE